jgi:hypothetical protein
VYYTKSKFSTCTELLIDRELSIAIPDQLIGTCNTQYSIGLQMNCKLESGRQLKGQPRPHH